MTIDEPQELLIKVSKLLGIDPVLEPQYLWIAQMACKAKADPEWKEFTGDNGRVMYFNTRTQSIQETHPVIHKYSQLLAKQKAFSNSSNILSNLLDDSKQVELYEIIRLLKDRQSRGMAPVTPSILQRLSVLLQVDHHKEFQLVRCIRRTLEIFLEQQHDLTRLLTDLSEPIISLRQAYASQIKEDIAQLPTHVIFCQECESRSAIVKCKACGDYFCRPCFQNMHATGNRRFHPTLEVEQLVCIICDREISSSQCIQCGTFFCDNCFTELHASRAELHDHMRRVITGLICLECEHYDATAVCEDCLDAFCNDCFLKAHSRGRRRNHRYLKVDSNGQLTNQEGRVLSLEEAREITRQAKSSEASGPWEQFQDDAGNFYSFNLATGEINSK